MRKLLGFVVATFLGSAALAQEDTTIAVVASDGAVLRALDTVTGKLVDIDVTVGETAVFERLAITLSECRYPEENPAGDAFALLKIRDVREEDARFEGWMVASSPALSSMDHPRYDVWVLRCRIPKPAPEPEETDNG